MKQLVQTLKNGEIEVIDVPPPILSGGMVMVKNHYSLISAGTEGSTARVARKSLIGKAKERPQQVKQVLDLLKQQGPVQTYRAVMKKLDAYSPLGYSTAGQVIEVAPDVRGIAVGDFVACGGGRYASHAEIVALPYNLCVKLPENADLKKAAYNTLGSIAIQGIRQADLRIGESCAVIGLGLIGQLTCLILRAGGIKVVGIDIDPHMVDMARAHCTDMVFTRSASGLGDEVVRFAEGIGVDAVIITAGTRSLDPVNFAGRIARKKGKIVIVGDVPTGFDRDAYYKKELDLRMSCSYGPGRYDLNYEEKGIDYPVAYVRWTEKRNMAAFQELVHSGKIDLDYMTTHIFGIEEAPKAYELILEKKEPYLGLLIKYPQERTEVSRKIMVTERPASGIVNAAFIGAGSYAMSYLLPNIPRETDVVLKAVMDASGTVSRKVAEKYGFEFCTSDENDIFGNPEINTVFIATRHDSHAGYVLKSIQAGKHVHVEKPLCLNETQLLEIKAVYDDAIEKGESPLLMVGFNRRFSPLTGLLKERLGSGPMAMIYRVNAGAVPSDTWIQDPDIGGGRIIGEICHFVDFLTFLNGSLPESISASAMADPKNLEDTVAVNLRFKNGSIGTVCYYANGSKSLTKEYIEVFQSGKVGIIRDFRELEFYGDGKKFRKKLAAQDKGQKKMIRMIVDSIKEGKPAPVPLEDIFAATLTTFKIMESLRNKSVISVG